MLVSNDADIKVCDFGFAKKITDLLPDETACGTPGYVAPEILRGDPYGPEVDVWSMGVICYVLLAGYPPFYDEDQRKLFKKIKDGRYYFHDEYWSHVSTDAMDLIRKMLCVNQKQRWSARELLRHPWIMAGDEELNKKDLTGTIVTLKKFNMKSKFRAAADAVILSNRMNRLMNFKKAIADAIAAENEEEIDNLNTSAPGFVRGEVSPKKTTRTPVTAGDKFSTSSEQTAASTATASTGLSAVSDVSNPAPGKV
jgi:serine/threonine protein kinase